MHDIIMLFQLLMPTLMIGKGRQFINIHTVQGFSLKFRVAQHSKAITLEGWPYLRDIFSYACIWQ